MEQNALNAFFYLAVWQDCKPATIFNSWCHLAQHLFVRAGAQKWKQFTTHACHMAFPVMSLSCHWHMLREPQSHCITLILHVMFASDYWVLSNLSFFGRLLLGKMLKLQLLPFGHISTGSRALHVWNISLGTILKLLLLLTVSPWLRRLCKQFVILTGIIFSRYNPLWTHKNIHAQLILRSGAGPRFGSYPPRWAHVFHPPIATLVLATLS